MKTVEAFPAMWYRCPSCGEQNTLRYSLVEEREPEGPCRGCGLRWTFDSMARENFRVNGFNPFPNTLFRAATEFICDECGRTNTVINPISGQSVRPVDDDDGEQVMLALQQIEEIESASCKFCGERYALQFDLPEEP